MNSDDTGINEAATRLLGLEGVSVIKVKDDGAGGSTVYVVTNEDSARACPSCGVFATRLKDYRTTRPWHLPCGGRPVSIRWRKARWYCAEPVCERGSFTEAIHAVPAGMRTTTALRRAAGAAGCGLRSAVCGLRRIPHRRAGRPRPVLELADRAAVL
ncbi:transposase family protein [Streptomyces spongiicola]|uniref:transposase family protein n=1 Tax=Streptomyces spongiicola TaxID=1690221 RepID=UPI0034085973